MSALVFKFFPKNAWIQNTCHQSLTSTDTPFPIVGSFPLKMACFRFFPRKKAHIQSEKSTLKHFELEIFKGFLAKFCRVISSSHSNALFLLSLMLIMRQDIICQQSLYFLSYLTINHGSMTEQEKWNHHLKKQTNWSHSPNHYVYKDTSFVLASQAKDARLQASHCLLLKVCISIYLWPNTAQVCSRFIFSKHKLEQFHSSHEKAVLQCHKLTSLERSKSTLKRSFLTFAAHKRNKIPVLLFCSDCCCSLFESVHWIHSSL